MLRVYSRTLAQGLYLFPDAAPLRVGNTSIIRGPCDSTFMTDLADPDFGRQRRRVTMNLAQIEWPRRSVEQLWLKRVRILFAAVAGLVVAAVVVIARDEPSLTRIDGGSGIPGALPLPFVIAHADTVFVGTVDAISGPEIVHTHSGQATATAYRVAYRVERLLKGNPTPKLVLTDAIGRGFPVFSAEVGRKYLVFAASGAFGSRDVRRLMPLDASHSVFLTKDGRTATNDRHVSVNIDELEARLGCRRVILGMFFVRC